MECVFVCVKEREGSAEEALGCAACYGSFSRHVAFVACKINTSQYLRAGKVVSLVLIRTHTLTI